MQAEARMNDGYTDGEPNGSGDARRDLRLLELLRDLVREEGRMEAAEMLGVNYKTLVRTVESGRMSRRVGDAVERLLTPGEGEEVSARSRQRDRIEALEKRVGGLEERSSALGEEMSEGLGGLRSSLDEVRSAVDAEVKAMREEHARALRLFAERLTLAEAVGGTAAAAPVRGRGVLRDLSPLVVTEEPDDDDEEVYGAAWPVIDEWRRLREGHPNSGSTLSWLAAEERLLTMELALLEEFGLTLPPETQPLRGFGRNGQINWRRAALYDTQRALARRRLLRSVHRVLTLGLWRN